MKIFIFICCAVALAVVIDVSPAAAIKVAGNNAFEHVAISPESGQSPVSSSNVVREVSTKSTTPMKWIQQMIDAHNYYRRIHKVPTLRFNNSLCEISQAWANHLARTKSFSHNYATASKYRIGENLAKYSQYGRPRYVNGSEAVVLWYNEIKDYNFKTGKSNTGYAVGHFTQLIWRASQSMGAAMAVRREGKNNFVYIVANYYPQGNVNGQFTRNVPGPTRASVARPYIADFVRGTTTSNSTNSDNLDTNEFIQNTLIYMYES